MVLFRLTGQVALTVIAWNTLTVYKENEDCIRNHFGLPLSMVLKNDPGFSWEAPTHCYLLYFYLIYIRTFTQCWKKT